jgi:hypothetical protein
MPERLEIPNTKITLYGAKQQIKQAINYFNKSNIQSKITGDESSDRLVLMTEYLPNIKCAISYNGNTVWNKERLIRDFKRIINNGMKNLSGYLYEFFHLSCGSIAHFNKQGWIATYPTLASLRNFFIKNEYGEPIITHIPSWQVDAVEIAQAMDRMLNKLHIKQARCNICSQLVGDTIHDCKTHISQHHPEALILKLRELFYPDAVNQ